MKLIALSIACSAMLIPYLAAQAQTAARNACAADVQVFCGGVQPGGGRIIACLRQHSDQVSDGCKRAAGVPVPTAGKPAPAASPATPTADDNHGGVDASTSSTSDPASDSSPAHNFASNSHPAAFAVASLAVGPSKAKVKFVQRDILDRDHDNMRALTYYIPETWGFYSQLTWHYDAPWYPVSTSARAENPANAEAYFAYPPTRMTYTVIPPQLRQYAKGIQPGMAPLPPVQALTLFIKHARGNIANVKWVGQQDLPDMAKALKVPDASNLHGVAVKISYAYRGQPVDEAFFGLFYQTQGSNSGVNAGVIKSTIWGFEYLQSFRAPAGQLEKNMATFSVIAKSLYINPEWIKLQTQITDQITAAVQAKIKQGYAQTAASKAAAEQTMAQAAAFNKNFEAQEAKLRSPGFDDSWLRTSSGGAGGGDGSHSAADHFSNLIREEDTVNDPSTGSTKQLTNGGSNHFTNGLGDYRTYDDPNMTPEKAGESGSWDRMTIVP